jgi:hypothetical protein
LPPVARSLPAETGNDLTTATPGRVPVCHREPDSLGRSRKRPRLRQRPDGCPFADARRPPLAEAGRGRFTRQRPDGCPVTTARATHVGRGRIGFFPQRLPDGARSPLHARPTSAEAEEDLARSDFRTVPGHHCTRDPRRPRPERTLHAATSGRCPRSRSTSSRSVWIDVATRWVVPTELALAQLRPKPPPRARSHSRHGSEPLISPRSKRLECVAYSPVESHLPSCGHEDA